MKIYTAYPRARSEPVLVREGFSWGAALLGPFWLAAHRAWIAAVIMACAEAAVALAVHGPARPAILLWAAWMTGVFGHDLWRAALCRGGMRVIAAADRDSALFRLLANRPA